MIAVNWPAPRVRQQQLHHHRRRVGAPAIHVQDNSGAGTGVSTRAGVTLFALEHDLIAPIDPHARMKNRLNSR